MIKILGRPNSVNVQKVMWCAAELRVAVDRSDIGGPFGGNNTADYLSNNPNGKIPTLIDGDYVLWESNAIVRYLCDQYGSAPWQPESAKDRGHASQWMDWYLTSMHGPMTTIFWQLIRTSDADRNHEAIGAAVTEASALWAILDQHLETRDYILGDTPSMADIPLGCAAYRWHSMQFDRPDLVNLKAWWDRLVSREVYRENVMIPLS